LRSHLYYSSDALVRAIRVVTAVTLALSDSFRHTAVLLVFTAAR